MQEELLSKEYGNSYVFLWTVKCSLQVRKCSSSYSLLFVITEKEGFTEKFYGHTICALLFFTEFCGKILGPINVKKVFEVKCLSEFTKPKEY